MQERSTIKKLDDSFLDCRDLGHSWAEYSDEEIKDNGWTAPFGWLRVFMCPTCDTRRFDVIDARGEIGHRRYEYPSGYMLVKHTPAKAPFRVELARRRGIRLSSRKQKHG